MDLNGYLFSGRYTYRQSLSLRIENHCQLPIAEVYSDKAAADIQWYSYWTICSKSENQTWKSSTYNKQSTPGFKHWVMLLMKSFQWKCFIGRKEGNVLFNDALNTFIYGYMASDVWLRTILIVRKETRCCHIGYSFRLTARVLLYAPSHRQDSTYHSLCYTSCGAQAGTRNSSIGPPHEGSIRRPIAPWANALTMELHLAPWNVL